MKPETKFRMRVQQFLSTLEPAVFAESIQQQTICGTPDILCCIRGNFVAIEVKAEGGRLSPLQAYKIQKIIDADGIAIEVNPSNFDVFKKLITELNDEAELGDLKPTKLSKRVKKDKGVRHKL